jgi:hypothetical protein
VRLQPRAPADASASARRRPAARVRGCGSHRPQAAFASSSRGPPDACAGGREILHQLRFVRAGETELTRCVCAGAVLPPFLLFTFFLTWLLPFLCLYVSPVYVPMYVSIISSILFGNDYNGTCRGMEKLEWHISNLCFCNGIFPKCESCSGIDPINPYKLGEN